MNKESWIAKPQFGQSRVYIHFWSFQGSEPVLVGFAALVRTPVFAARLQTPLSTIVGCCGCTPPEVEETSGLSHRYPL